MKKNAITHLKLVTHKLDLLEPFYSNVLGLPVKRISDTEIEVKAGATSITFTQTNTFDPEAPPMYHFALNISENKLATAIDWLSERDISLLPDTNGEFVFDFVNWNAHSVYFYDPGGNQLEFIARHELDNASEGKFTSDDILAVSEIGLVVDDFPGTKDLLYKHFGLLPYREPGPTFGAIGDANGLFIVVTRGRIWLASDVRADVFPTEVGLAGEVSVELEIEGLPYRIFSVATDS